MILSHAAAIYMKKEPLRRKKIAIGMGATSLAMLVFVVLGIFRVGYIEEHAVIPITPSYFVLINTFLFIVATLLSLTVGGCEGAKTLDFENSARTTFVRSIVG